MATIGGAIVLISTLVYLFYLSTKTKSILFLLGKTAIFGIVALIVVSLIGTILTSGHFFFGFIMLVLIFLVYVSLS